MTLISENNRQYYAGTQTFIADGVNFDFTTTFNTDLVFATADPTNVNWPTNNFYLEVSIDGHYIIRIQFLVTQLLLQLD